MPYPVSIRKSARLMVPMRNKGNLASVGISLVIIMIALVGIVALVHVVQARAKQEEAQKEVSMLASVIDSLQDTDITADQYNADLIAKIGSLPRYDYTTINGKTVLLSPFGGQIQIIPESSFTPSSP